jgi:MFS family permease
MFFMTPMNAWLLWGIASIFFAYQYILRVMPSVLLDDIMQKFNMDTIIMGQFSGVYYIGYALMHLPVGIMLDRFGPRKVMSSCILLATAGLVPLLLADGWLWPVIGRVMTGMGSSAAILGVFKIVRMAFTENKFTKMLSYSVAIGLMGAIYGGGPLAALSKQFGFTILITACTIIGVMLSILAFILLPEVKVEKSANLAEDLKIVLCNKKLLLFCLFAGLMVGPLEGFADTWGVEFLRLHYGLDKETAGYFTSLIFLGMCFGSPLLSWISEKSGLSTGIIIIVGLVMCGCFMLVLSGVVTSFMLMPLMAIVGLCCAYQIIAIYKVSTLVPERVVGLATATANMVIMTFGYGFHSIMGMIAKAQNEGVDAQSIFQAVSVVPAALIIGVLGFIIILLIEYSTKKIRSGNK